MHVVVAGGTGFIGTALVRRLVRDGRRVTVLTRRSEAEARKLLPRSVSVVRWQSGVPVAPLPAEADAVVNLAGAAIARRWTQAAKRLIVDSRVQTTPGGRPGAEGATERVRRSPGARRRCRRWAITARGVMSGSPSGTVPATISCPMCAGNGKARRWKPRTPACGWCGCAPVS